MKNLSLQRLDDAERCLWLCARVLERRRFEHLFRGGPRDAVLDALCAYQNPDGGFGQGLEPDFRGPVSQPLCALMALQVLDELDAFDSPLLPPLLGQLAATAAADGGAPDVFADARKYPRAPWWEPRPEPVPGGLVASAAIAGLLHKHRIAHPWLERASAFCWSALPRLVERAAAGSDRSARILVGYEARAAVTFLDHVPERARAERLAAELGRALASAKLFSLQHDAKAEAALPLEFAVNPSSLARRWFDDAIIEEHLDATIASQAQDGGFDVAWLIWTPITGLEWRGIQTVEQLKLLRAYGRLAH